MIVTVTAEDFEAARAVGATGAELVARSVHSALDRAGVPREGRSVEAAADTVTIDLPPGWTMPGGDDS